MILQLPQQARNAEPHEDREGFDRVRLGADEKELAPLVVVGADGAGDGVRRGRDRIGRLQGRLCDARVRVSRQDGDLGPQRGKLLLEFGANGGIRIVRLQVELRLREDAQVQRLQLGGGLEHRHVAADDVVQVRRHPARHQMHDRERRHGEDEHDEEGGGKLAADGVDGRHERLDCVRERGLAGAGQRLRRRATCSMTSTSSPFAWTRACLSLVWT
ncbi:hypothetical protein WDZ92_39530 [Nostoc sp. NIES-2111]